MSTTDAGTSPESETGPAFQVHVSSDGQGRVDFGINRGALSAMITFVDTTKLTDPEIAEFFHMLPAVVDRALTQLIEEDQT